MENKNKEKVAKAIKVLGEKAAKYNTDVKALIKNAFTPEICQMVKEIMEIRNADRLTYDIKSEYSVKISQIGIYAITKKNSATPLSRFTFDYCIPRVTDYDDNTISILGKSARQLNCDIKMLKIVEPEIPTIINYITVLYKEAVELQSNRIDNVLELLDCDYEPTKHIKVTVEWV